MFDAKLIRLKLFCHLIAGTVVAMIFTSSQRKDVFLYGFIFYDKEGGVCICEPGLF